MRKALALALLIGPASAATPAPMGLTVTAGVVVVIDPPSVLPCDRRGWVVTTDSGQIEAVSIEAQLMPAGVVIVPVLPGRIYCDGFE